MSWDISMKVLMVALKLEEVSRCGVSSGRALALPIHGRGVVGVALDGALTHVIAVGGGVQVRIGDGTSWVFEGN